METKYNVIIIGSGPAGYVAAIRAGQLGLKTAIIEKDKIGGLCLNWGCIPTKALLESARFYHKIKTRADEFGITGISELKLGFDWVKALERAQKVVGILTSGVDYLLKKNGVETINGEAKIISENKISVDNRLLQTETIIIATGAKPNKPDIKDGEQFILDFKELFSLDKIPTHVVINGEGSFAFEMAQFFALIGREVSLLIPGKKILPMFDERIADFMLKKLRKEKVRVIMDCKEHLKNASWSNAKLSLGDKEIPCDVMINGNQKTAVIPKADISIAKEGDYISVNKFCQTNYPTIFAIGDVNGISKYAHAASSQGLHVINFIKGIQKEIDPSKYPLNMYSSPEAAQIGITEEKAKEAGIDYKISEFPLSANGKALSEGHSEGFIRMISETKYGEVLGVQIVAEHATDMIAEASAYMKIESTVYDVAETIHAHPTLSEIFMESGFEAIDKAIQERMIPVQ